LRSGAVRDRGTIFRAGSRPFGCRYVDRRGRLRCRLVFDGGHLWSRQDDSCAGGNAADQRTGEEKPACRFGGGVVLQRDDEHSDIDDVQAGDRLCWDSCGFRPGRKGHPQSPICAGLSADCEPRGAVKTVQLWAVENRPVVGGHFQNRSVGLSSA
jgi:hypothetical protein